MLDSMFHTDLAKENSRIIEKQNIYFQASDLLALS